MRAVYLILSTLTLLASLSNGEEDDECTINGGSNNDYLNSGYQKFTAMDIQDSKRMGISLKGVSNIQLKYADHGIVSENALTFYKINESEFPSAREKRYYINFALEGFCDTTREKITVYDNYEIIDTNTFDPVFEKDVYEVNLISNFIEDFNRLMDLKPIIVKDNDITNGEVYLSITENKYVDIAYGGIVPSSLNKKHYAKLVLKTIPETNVELEITATDVGIPPRTSTATVKINPPGPPKPVFKKSSYIGDYYLNHTFIMRENPELEEGTTEYETGVTIYQSGDTFFAANLDAEGDINVYSVNQLGDITFYSNHYLVYELTAYYWADSTKQVNSNGATAIIVHLHHD